jgi:hypothetical protein
VLLAQDIWQIATDERHVRRTLQCAGNSKFPVVR